MPKGPFPKLYKTRTDLHLFRETSNQKVTYWFDSSQWRFLPDNQRYSEVALIPNGQSINVIRVWSPIEFLPPGDFKMRCQVPVKHGDDLDIEIWMTVDHFNQYFSVF
jgi:hypothetical protein